MARAAAKTAWLGPSRRLPLPRPQSRRFASPCRCRDGATVVIRRPIMVARRLTPSALQARAANPPNNPRPGEIVAPRDDRQSLGPRAVTAANLRRCGPARHPNVGKSLTANSAHLLTQRAALVADNSRDRPRCALPRADRTVGEFRCLHKTGARNSRAEPKPPFRPKRGRLDGDVGGDEQLGAPVDQGLKKL